jgi:hypothetical protein
MRPVSGPFNLCTPAGATNQAVLQRPVLFPLPVCALQAAVEELATVMLDSQHLLPARLGEAGSQFAFLTLSQALHQILHERDGVPPGEVRGAYV